MRLVLPSGQLVDLVKSESVLGRASDNDIVVSDPSVSRIHCRILRTTDGFVVKDLGSRNGTFVNTKRIEHTTRLREGDTLRVGDISIRVTATPPGAKPVTLSQPARRTMAERVPRGSTSSNAPLLAVVIILVSIIALGGFALFIFNTNTSNTFAQQTASAQAGTFTSVAMEQGRALTVSSGVLETATQAAAIATQTAIAEQADARVAATVAMQATISAATVFSQQTDSARQAQEQNATAAAFQETVSAQQVQARNAAATAAAQQTGIAIQQSNARATAAAAAAQQTLAALQANAETAVAATLTAVAPPPPPPQPPPPSGNGVSFRADRTILRQGESTVLRWDVDNVREVYLEDRGVGGHDSRVVQPNESYTYRLRVVPLNGRDQFYPLTITVAPPDHVLYEIDVQAFEDAMSYRRFTDCAGGRTLNFVQSRYASLFTPGHFYHVVGSGPSQYSNTIWEIYSHREIGGCP